MTKSYTINVMRNDEDKGLVKLLRRVEEISHYSNRIQRVIGILAHYICAVFRQSRNAITEEPSVEYLNLADKLLWLTAALEVHELMVAGKLVGLARRWRKGQFGSPRGA